MKSTNSTSSPWARAWMTEQASERTSAAERKWVSGVSGQACGRANGSVLHPKDFELLRRSKKNPIPNFCKGHVHQNILSQHKSKPHWLLSFFCGPWQDIALFESGKICSLSLIVSSKTEGVALFTCKWVGQSESALIFTHDLDVGLTSYLKYSSNSIPLFWHRNDIIPLVWYEKW